MTREEEKLTEEEIADNELANDVDYCLALAKENADRIDRLTQTVRNVAVSGAKLCEALEKRFGGGGQ